MMSPRYLPNGPQYRSTRSGNRAMRLPSQAMHTPTGMDHQARKGRLGSLPLQSAVMVQDCRIYPRYPLNRLTSRNHRADRHQSDRIGGRRPDIRRHPDHQIRRLRGFLMQPI